MKLAAGTLKRLHVNRHVIRANETTGAREPVFTVKHRGRTYRPRAWRIDGPSWGRYEPEHPLPCGARVWVETKAEVILEMEESSA